MDIKDFFPSISQQRVAYLFENIGYAPNVSKYLSALCCLNNAIPQGAATSPMISNIVCFHMDKNLSDLSKSYMLTYTRYADDMTFSGDIIDASFQLLVEDVVKKAGFQINKEKSILIKGKNQKIVTGLSVNSMKPTILKSYKRKVRQEAYHLITKGYISHTQTIKQNDILYIERILGKLSFWNQIEPNNHFVNWAITSIKSKSQTLL